MIFRCCVCPSVSLETFARPGCMAGGGFSFRIAGAALSGPVRWAQSALSLARMASLARYARMCAALFVGTQVSS